jgi:NTE family protein
VSLTQPDREPVQDTVAGSAGAPGRQPAARVALVLGAGGVAGIAFHAGVLAAMAESLGWDPRRVDLIVATSAGSITAAGLRAGLSAADIYARTRGEALSPEGAALLAGSDAVMGGRAIRRPEGRPRLVPAAPGVVWAAGRRPGRVRPGALIAGLIPVGRIPTTAIAEGVDALDGGAWPERTTWICTVRLHDGRLVVFGRPGAPPATMGQAVAASCAIPGFFAPVEIGGVRYIDGGAHSTTNLSQVSRLGLDLVVVSAPMARAGSRPQLLFPRFPAALGAVGRELNRLQLGVEARRVRAGGTPVVAFSPTPMDRSVMGFNPMDESRRAPIASQARESALRRLERPEVRDQLAALTD